MKNETTFAVRYAETDQMGVVHHSNYLVWFEVGRTNFMNDAGFHYAKLEENGILAPVIDANLKYIRPAKYGERVNVTTTLATYNGVRMTYQYEVKNESGELIVTGTTSHTIVKKDTFRPVRLKNVLPEMHKVYERLINEGA